MLKAIPLAALLAFASPAFADEKPCFPVGVTIATAPFKESARLDGEALAKFKEGLAGNMKAGADPVPADADLIILFKGEKVTGFATVRDGCTLGTGVLDNRMLDRLLDTPGRDGSI